MTLTPLAFTPPQVQGLDVRLQKVVDDLFTQWAVKLPRNIERMMYRDGKNKLKDFGVAIPPQLLDKLDVVMGWPEKAVFEMANRIVLEQIRSTTGDITSQDPFGFAETLFRNRFAVELPMAIASSLAHSVSFVSTTPGDIPAGEPDAMIQFHSAMWATGLWDRRRRELTAGLVISETDANGAPTRCVVLLPEIAITCVKASSGIGTRTWYVERVAKHRIPHTPMEMLPFRPTLERPFGRARIDRQVMSLTDRGVRGGSRLEVHSELFSAMKLLLLGVGEDAFRDKQGNMVPLWSFYMGRLNYLSNDEDGKTPTLERITAESPEPHIAVMRQLAMEFSGHTGVPLGSLGIATDNPESADAKTVAREDIVADAEAQQTIYGHSLQRSLGNLLIIRDGLHTYPDELYAMELKWRRPDRVTDAAIADAGSKQVAAVPALADSPVGLELLGLDRPQIDRHLAYMRRQKGGGVLDRLLARQDATLNAELESAEPDGSTDEG